MFRLHVLPYAIIGLLASSAIPDTAFAQRAAVEVITPENAPVHRGRLWSTQLVSIRYGVREDSERNRVIIVLKLTNISGRALPLTGSPLGLTFNLTEPYVNRPYETRMNRFGFLPANEEVLVTLSHAVDHRDQPRITSLRVNEFSRADDPEGQRWFIALPDHDALDKPPAPAPADRQASPAPTPSSPAPSASPSEGASASASPQGPARPAARLFGRVISTKALSNGIHVQLQVRNLGDEPITATPQLFSGELLHRDGSRTPADFGFFIDSGSQVTDQQRRVIPSNGEAPLVLRFPTNGRSINEFTRITLLERAAAGGEVVGRETLALPPIGVSATPAQPPAGPQPAPSPTPPPTPAPAPAPAPVPAPVLVQPTADLSRYAGTYVSSRDTKLTLTVTGDALSGRARGENGVERELLTLRPVGDGRFEGQWREMTLNGAEMGTARLGFDASAAAFSGTVEFTAGPMGPPVAYSGRRERGATAAAAPPPTQTATVGGGFRPTRYLDLRVDRTGRTTRGIEVALTARNGSPDRKGIQYEPQRLSLVDSNGREHGTDGNYYGANGELLHETVWLNGEQEGAVTYVFPYVPQDATPVRLIVRANGEQSAAFDLAPAIISSGP